MKSCDRLWCDANKTFYDSYNIYKNHLYRSLSTRDYEVDTDIQYHMVYSPKLLLTTVTVSEHSFLSSNVKKWYELSTCSESCQILIPSKKTPFDSRNESSRNFFNRVKTERVGHFHWQPTFYIQYTPVAGLVGLNNFLIRQGRLDGQDRLLPK